MKKNILLILAVFLILPLINATKYASPSFSSLDVTPYGDIKTCDLVQVKGSIPDAFYPFPDDWLTLPIFGLGGYLNTYKISFDMQLQYWVVDFSCPFGCWVDYSHQTSVNELEVDRTGYDPHVHVYQDGTLVYSGKAEDRAEELMISFDTPLGRLRKKD